MNSQKIKFSWDIHYKCNFRCPYCWFYKVWANMSKRNIYLSPDEWMAHWRRIYDKYGEVRIEIVGGEPFIYPRFIELVKKLSVVHSVKITTNLSGDIEHFVKEVSPERVSLDLNYHISFIDLETVIKKALILKKAGFTAGICYLAYPPQMGMIGRVSKRFQEAGIDFALAAFWGEHNGKKYPESYTQEERDTMRPYLGDIDRVDYHLNAQSPRGKLCNAGYKYANIQGNGNVVRCGHLNDKVVGNITDENFNLFSSPSLCEADSCPCNEYNNILSHEEDKYSNEQLTSFQQNVIDLNKEVGGKEDSSRKVSFIEISFTWDIHYMCNYRFSYCFFFGQWEALSKKNRYIDIDRWKNIWSDIYKKYGKCHIHITGGEPFVYPDFFDLINFLSKMHSLEFDTNLSFEIDDFLGAINSVKTQFNASHHPEFSDFDLFFKKILILKKNNHEVSINYVGHPAFLEPVERYKDICVKNGINFRIMPFKGTYEGVVYPANYSQSDRGIAYTSTTDNSTKEMGEWYDSSNLLNAKEIKAERVCHLGHTYAKIHPDGNAYRCCIAQDEGRLGNLMDGTFSLFDEPKICKYDRCSCWRAPIIGEERRWESFWKKIKS